MALVPLNPPAPGTLAQHTHWNAPAGLKYWHLASLDAPTVAVTWACSFAWAAGARLPAWPVAVLGLLVWAIYVADRLLDVRAALAHPSRHLLQQRHHFHWRHRRILIALGACAAAAAAWMIAARLPITALRRDSLIGLATLVYLSNVHSHSAHRGWMRRITQSFPRMLSRECVVGIIFSAGCLLPALARSTNYAALAGPAVAFAAVAWLNLAAIASWETDCRRGNSHSVRLPGSALGCACLVSALAMAQPHPHSALLITAAGISAFLLAILDARAAAIEPVILRAAADLVLLTPILALAAGAIA